MEEKKYSEKDLLSQIKELKKQVQLLKKRKKYGLVWEEKPEIFEKKSKNALPVLVEKGGKFKDIISNKDDDYNILIEGDNYHSLSILKYTHRNMIDVIYIDPPYNTGKKDFIYNDHIVDKEDTFRHSKWLSFMDKRLRIAKDLLKNEGAIFISIDDNEQAQLKLLCDSIFNENNFVGILAVENNPKGRKNSKYISKSSEFVLVYVKNKNNELSFFKENVLKDTEFLEDNSGRKYTHGKRVLVGESSNDIVLDFSSKKNYVVYYNREKHHLLTRRTDNLEVDQSLIADGYNLYQSKKDNLLIENTYSEDKFLKLFFDNALIFKENSIYEKDFNLYTRIKSLLKNSDSLDLKTETAGKTLKDLNIEFSNPKNISFIKILITLFNKKNTTVLDFMAGSGTTGHAVLELNKEDGGNRKFILCTSNESKICEEVTYKRLMAVSKGYKKQDNEKVEALGGNLKYLKTDFIKVDPSIDDLKQKIVDASTEILCLKESTFIENKIQDNITVFENKHQYTAILFDTFFLKDFIEVLKKLNDRKVSVYVFSYDKDFSKEEFGNLSDKIDFSVEPIPEKLLETYRDIFNF